MNDVQGYSRALYSNWFWHKSTHLLVDAGEGLHLALGAGVWQPNVVAITHGHSDHVLGLAGFAGARRFGKGATTKPWTVLHPVGSSGVEAMQAAIAGLWRGVEFPIVWRAVAPGDSLALGQHRSIEAFGVQHVPGEQALGYRVLEWRRRRRAEYAGLAESDIERIARREGRDQVVERHQHILFAHSGDAMPIDPALVRGADLLVHDATFLGGDERREPIHATTEEAFAVARAAGVTSLVLNHLSVRYDRAAALPRIKQQLAASGFAGACWLLDEGAFVPLG
jgi:ribonuclease Z